MAEPKTGLLAAQQRQQKRIEKALVDDADA